MKQGVLTEECESGTEIMEVARESGTKVMEVVCESGTEVMEEE